MTPRALYPIGSPVATPDGVGLVQAWVNVGVNAWWARVAYSDGIARGLVYESEVRACSHSIPSPPIGRYVTRGERTFRVFEGGRGGETAMLDARA